MVFAALPLAGLTAISELLIVNRFHVSRELGWSPGSFRVYGDAPLAAVVFVALARGSGMPNCASAGRIALAASGLTVRVKSKYRLTVRGSAGTAAQIESNVFLS